MYTISEIINPSIEEQFRNFVRENGAGPFNEHYVTQFIKRRIGAVGIDQDQLAAWVFHLAPLDERQKRELLTQIDAASVATYLELFGVTRDPAKMMELESRLADKPNPSLDQLLIGHYWDEPADNRWGDSAHGPRTTALLKTDTPAVRKFITRVCWETKRDKWLDRLQVQGKANLARLAWMTPLVEQLTDTGSKVKAVKLLASFRTPEADKLLDRWAGEDNAELRKAAEQQRAEQKKEDAEHARRLQQWSDLLAGKIQPEDLVPPQKPWLWDGKQYVQEK